METIQVKAIQGKAVALLSVATDLFARQGYSATTTLQISKRAGATEPLIFYHFQNKDGCYGYVARLAHTGFREFLGEVDAVTDPVASLSACIDRVCAFATDFPAQARLVSSPVPSRLRGGRAELEVFVDETRQRLQRLCKGRLQDGMKAGTVARVPLEHTANLLMLMLNGVLHQEIEAPGTARKMKTPMVDFCRRALAA